MKMRLNYHEISPDALKLMLEGEKYIKQSTIDPKILELVKIRASQINGCAFCLDMHTKDAVKKGETEQRIYLLNAWKDTDLYSEAEQAALLFTEKLTLISQNHITDELFDLMKKHFDDKQIVDLIFAINGINAWNRFNIVLTKKGK